MNENEDLAKVGVLDQIAHAVRPRNRLAFAVGALLGGFIPVASYTICHSECDARPFLWILVIAGFAYSALSVFQWARIAFRHPIKALGFVVLSEGVIFFSRTEWLSFAALGVIVLINGISTAMNLIADRRGIWRKERKKKPGAEPHPLLFSLKEDLA